MKILNFLFLLFFSHLALLGSAQELTLDIRLNQVGFLPNAKKIAAVVGSQSTDFKVFTSDLQTEVFAGKLLPSATYSAAEEQVSIVDFTLLTTPGEYVVVVSDLGKSVSFSVRQQVFTDLAKSSIKAFYYNRASTAILAEYGGIYARKAGHPDNVVVVHPSAASAARPAGTVISTPGGWYDAGDYNKYIVNSGISTFTLLSAYETYPAYYDTLNLNIPESSNTIPDLLDEALWNIKWMMTMQDPADGGVYTKTTEANFSSFAMPSEVNAVRYVVAKSTAATLDFAAIMAMTARIYKKYDPTLAANALAQSVKAWEWAQSNPNVEFNNPSASGNYPSIGTGGYGDTSFADEFSWCASELYITTQDDAYYNEIDLNGTYDVPGWPSVKTLGLLSLLVHKKELTAAADTTLMKSKLIDLVAGPKENIVTSPYRIPGDFFFWGGNNAYANMGMLCMQAFRITNDATYFSAAISSLDYLLGRNATQYCFVTGTGTKRPMNIHHRISGADGIDEPIPGMLVGGSNAGNITDCGADKYPSTLPAKGYVDLSCSYSTNEVAINWNAPLVFLVGAVDSEYQNNFRARMPSYLSISTKKISLPSKAGVQHSVVIESNTDWKFMPSADWIEVSPQTGQGVGKVNISSKSDNTDETDRDGKVYIYKLEELVDSIQVLQTGDRAYFRMQCEDYFVMLGLQTETTTDIGGGANLGFADAGDYAMYHIDVSYAGIYEVTFRHAGYAGGFDLKLDGKFLKTISFAATTDWQDWADYTTQLALPEGFHELTIEFKQGGTNLNWIDFNWQSALALSQDKPVYSISVYPIPAHDFLRVAFGEVKNRAEIQLYSLDGRVVLQRNFHAVAEAALSMADVTKGVYILRIDCDSVLSTEKVVVN